MQTIVSILILFRLPNEVEQKTLGQFCCCRLLLNFLPILIFMPPCQLRITTPYLKIVRNKRGLTNIAILPNSHLTYTRGAGGDRTLVQKQPNKAY